MILTDCHTHTRENSNDIIRICNLFPEESGPYPFLFSAGIHPKQINEKFMEQDMLKLGQLLAEPGCFAVGECGLDRFSQVSMPIQETCFLRQAELAEEHDFPLILHCVRCWPDIIRIRKQLRPVHLWVAHGFRSSPEMAEELLEHGIIPSFGASLLTDKRNSKVLASLSNDCFLIETDESQLSPEQLYAKAAELRNCPLESLEEAVLTNFRRIFTKHQSTDPYRYYKLKSPS